MSLSIDGTWKVGVWLTTVWADGVWLEGAAQTAVKTGTGGIDPARRRRSIVKPLGTLHLPKKARKDVADRLDESRQIAAEVAAKLAQDFGAESATLAARASAMQAPSVELSMLEINAEIGALIRKKLRTEEDEVLLLTLMAAAAA